jgi:hypothetical protein
MAFVAALLMLGLADDGDAQGSSTLTITKQVEGAVADETFPVHVDMFATNERVDVDLTPGTPVTVDVVPGEISIFEPVPVGWRFGSLVCTGPDPFVPVNFQPAEPGEVVGGIVMTLPEGIAVECVLTNIAAPTGTIEVRAIVDGENPDAAAVHQIAVEPVSPQSLLAGETIDVETNAGPAFVNALPADGFGTFFIDCGDAVVLSRFGAGVQVEVPANGVVACTAILVGAPVANLTIQKLTEQDADDLQFPFSLGAFEFDLAPSFAPGFGGIQLALGPGPYEIVELPTEGWFLQSSGCSGFGVELIDQGVRITPEQDQDVTCTFINALVSEAPELGDANCDGLVDIVDALVIAQYETRVRALVQQCPLGDAASELFEPAADVDDSGAIDIIDALVVARCTAGLPAPLCPDN